MKTGRLTTEQQLQNIRAGLIPPRRLFAKIQELFAANAPTSNAAHRLVSHGNPDSLREWTCGDGTTVLARTRSEARAVWKKQARRPIPTSTQFFRKAA